MPIWVQTALLLAASNVFMTFAWYGHLKNLSTSPWYSFLVAWAKADSTAPKTTSRSTFFSREMASTNINNSRFMQRLSCFYHPQTAPDGTAPQHSTLQLSPALCRAVPHAP